MEIPDDVHTITCHTCGGPTRIDPARSTAPTEQAPTGSAFLVCSAGDGWFGVFTYGLDREQYVNEFGHHPLATVTFDDDDPSQPMPPEQRVLPPGPWGVTGVPATEIPDDAWHQRCPNKLGRAREHVCGKALIPNPGHVFYYDEFRSVAVLGMACRGGCRYVFERYEWGLTDEQHLQVFGRTLAEYRPKVDPDDYDEGEAPPAVEYGFWRTADRACYQEFPTLDDLIGCQDWDLRAIAPGEYTIRHWPTGGEWDVPAFVADHADAVAAEYADIDAELALSGRYDEETGEWIDDPDDEAEA